MSRTQLLDMANNAQSASSCSGSPAAQETVENVSAEGLQTLQPSPDEEFGWDELADKRAIAARGPLIEDDVNGLSLINGASPPSSSSYLGFTSIPSMIRILLKVTPQCRGGVSQQAFASLPPAKSRSGQVVQPINLSTCEIDEAAFVDAYFLRVHSITPMVDEADFRRRMAVDKGCMEEHTSGSWQALKNMVLALGSIAGTDASQPTHILYYQRASQYFDLSCLGSGHIHTVQALALLGGFYLHYCNRPNMAGAVMGATVRLAVGMGLHLAEQSSPASGKGHASLARQKDVEIRIRTWWSVICLDTWAGTTLGRPDVGCVGKDLVSTSLPTLRFSMVSFVYFLCCLSLRRAVLIAGHLGLRSHLSPRQSKLLSDCRSNPRTSGQENHHVSQRSPRLRRRDEGMVGGSSPTFPRGCHCSRVSENGTRATMVAVLDDASDAVSAAPIEACLEGDYYWTCSNGGRAKPDSNVW